MAGFVTCHSLCPQVVITGPECSVSSFSEHSGFRDYPLKRLVFTASIKEETE